MRPAYFLTIAAVIGYYLWLFFGTDFIFPIDQYLFAALLTSPPVLLLLAAAVSAFNHQDSMP